MDWERISNYTMEEIKARIITGILRLPAKVGIEKRILIQIIVVTSAFWQIDSTADGTAAQCIG